MPNAWMQTAWFAWGVLPLLIFFSRILDVSIGTVRIIMMSKGHRVLVPVLGFFEVVIWVLVIGQVMQNLSNPVTYLAYGLGFATGTYVGMRIEEALSIGHVVIRIITHRPAHELADALDAAGYGVTIIDAMGSKGPVSLVYSVVKKKRLGALLALVNQHNPKAFYTVEDVERVREGWPYGGLEAPPAGRLRKGK